MVSNITHRKLKNVSFFFLSVILLSSCTIYQTIPTDDGIYSNNRRNTRVIVVEKDADPKDRISTNNTSDYNYFSRELDRLNGIEDDDVFVDVDSYSSMNDTIIVDEGDTVYRQRAWGQNNDDVVVNINLAPNNFAWGFWDPWVWDPYYNGWGWNNWGWNRWGWNSWGWNNWGWNRWGVGFHPGWGIGWGWNNPYYGFHFRRRFGFRNFYTPFNNLRYGRRLAYNGNRYRNANRRNINTNFNRRRGSSTINSNNRRGNRNTSFRNRSSNSRRSTINNSSRRRSNNRSSVRPSSRSRSSINRSSRGRSSRGTSRGSSRRRG